MMLITPPTPAPPQAVARHSAAAGLVRACLLFLALSLLPALPAMAQSDAAHQQFLFAYKLMQRGEDKLAAEEFDKYLASFPHDSKQGDARYYRALLYRRSGDNSRAIELLRDVPVPELVPAHAVDLLRGQTHVDLRQFEAALLSLERIDVKAMQADVAVPVYYLRGVAYRGANNLTAAAEQLEAAAAVQSPLQGRALLDLARVQVLQDRHREAIDSLDSAMQISGTAVQAEAARLAGDVTYQRGEYDTAVRYYQRIITHHQATRHFGPAVTGTLWSHFAAGRHRAVLETYRQHLDALPAQDRVAAGYLAGSAHQELGDHTQAVAMFEAIARGQGQSPLQEKVFYKLAVSQYELGRYEAMQASLDELNRRFPQSEHRVDGTYLLAAADARQGNVARGAARLTELIDEGPASAYYASALLRRARLYQQHSRLEPAMADYERYLQHTRESNENTPATLQATRELLDLYQRLDRLAELKGLAQSLLASPTLDPQTEQEALYRLAMAQIRLREIEDALATLERLDTRHPLHAHEADTAYYRGLLLTNLGRTKDALPLLMKASRHEGLSAQRRGGVLRLLAIQHREAGRGDEARAALHQLEQLVGQAQLNATELLWLGRDALAGGEPDRVVSYLQPIAAGGREDVTPELRAEALYLMGQAHHRLGQHDRAVDAFNRVIAMGGGYEYESHLTMAHALAAQGKYEAALESHQLLLRSGVSRFEAAALHDSAQVYRMLAADALRRDQRQRHAEALREANRLLRRLVLLYSIEQLDPLPQLARLELYEVAREMDDLTAAQAELAELIEKYPNDPHAVYARALLAAHGRRNAEALRLLARLNEQAFDARLGERVKALRSSLEAAP